MGIRGTKALTAICLASALVVTGCTPGGRDDDKDGDKKNDDKSLTLDRFLDSLVDGYCRLSEECGEQNADACRAGAQAEMAFLEKSVESGRLKFLASAGKTCLDALEQATCETGESFFMACDFALMFEGAVKPGDECYDSLECGTEGHCVGDELLCPGTCKARIPVGGDCSGSDDRCVYGADCNDDDECEAYAKKGEPCGVECEGGLYCHRSDAHPDGICAERGGVGAECESSSHCQGNLHCRSSDGTCQQPIAQGGSCDPSDYGCANGLRCTVTSGGSGAGTCEPYKQKGEACVPGNGDCRYPFTCSAETNTCIDPAGLGEPCGYNGGEWVPCAEGSCSYMTNKCEPLKKEGEDCNAYTDFCENHLNCGEESGKCERPPVCEIP